jgi:hypothetical protein
MEHKAHQYKLTLQYLENNKGEAMNEETLEFDFESHDDIFSIIAMLKTKGLFEDEIEATKLAVGIKLFGEVMIKHRKDALFEELAPGFVEFMKKLKGQ